MDTASVAAWVADRGPERTGDYTAAGDTEDIVAKMLVDNLFAAGDGVDIQPVAAAIAVMAVEKAMVAPGKTFFSPFTSHLFD